MISLGKCRRTAEFGGDSVKTCRSGRRCGAKGCDNATAEGKPYCPEHVALNPYVAALLADMARRGVEGPRRSPAPRTASA